MGNPITDIEDKTAWTDMGRQAYMIYKGAIEEGSSIVEALAIVAAFYEGLFRSAKEQKDEGSES